MVSPDLIGLLRVSTRKYMYSFKSAGSNTYYMCMKDLGNDTRLFLFRRTRWEIPYSSSKSLTWDRVNPTSTSRYRRRWGSTISRLTSSSSKKRHFLTVAHLIHVGCECLHIVALLATEGGHLNVGPIHINRLQTMILIPAGPHLSGLCIYPTSFIINQLVLTAWLLVDGIHCDMKVCRVAVIVHSLMVVVLHVTGHPGIMQNLIGEAFMAREVITGTVFIHEDAGFIKQTRIKHKTFNNIKTSIFTIQYRQVLKVYAV